MADTFVWKNSQGAQRYVGFLEFWLAGQANNDNMEMKLPEVPERLAQYELESDPAVWQTFYFILF